MSKRSELPPFDIDAFRPPVTERQRKVIALLREGMPMTEVARTLGCSVWAVQGNRDRVLQRLRLQNEWHDGLSLRVRNCCNNYNITSREGLEEFIKSGAWRRVRNFGNVSMREVAAWLGWDLPTKQPNVVETALEAQALKLELAEAISALQRIQILSLRNSGVVNHQEVGDACRHLTRFQELPDNVRQLVIEVREKRFGIR